MQSYQEWLSRHSVTAFDPEKKYPPTEWLVEPLWLSGGKINGLFGTPKAGKSRFLSWALVAMLAGHNVLPGLRSGRRVERVLYLRGEESEEVIAHRLKRYAAIQGIAFSQLSSWSDRLLFMPAMNMMLERSGARAFLRKTIADHKADLVVADPYIRLHGADENDAQAMGRIHNALREWTDSDGFDLILVHHTGKLDETVALSTDISRWARGTSDIAAILDSASLLHRTAKYVVLYRTGRFPPQEKLKLLDGGDEHGWDVVT